MKILYISKNERCDKFPFLIDYQDDSLLYGLKELFGDDVVDCNKRYNLYSDYSDEEVASEYGRGFTFTRLLDSDKADRDDIVKKIKSKYFDLVIYGNVWRCLDHYDLVMEHYDHTQIVLVDGEDNPKMHQSVVGKGLYAKRELVYELNMELKDHFSKTFPVSFAFPTKKLNLETKKEKKLAISDPRDKKTYVFNREEDYYMDYRTSKYAFTMPKAGWDALRHYEIMGNGCVPLFFNLENCPRSVMYRFPKALLIKIFYFYHSDFKWMEKNYDVLSHDLFEHFKKYNTTKSNAEFFIKDIMKFRK